MKKLMMTTAALALLLAGCTDKSGYGSKPLTDFKEKPQEGLGSTTTEVAAPAAPPVTAPENQTTTTGPSTTTTTRSAAQGYQVKIQSDQSSTAFEPRVAQVFAGTPVTWTNTDSVPRSVEFSDQSYLSGPIPPGGTATFTANRAGDFNYSDGTRPYAVGTLRVQSR